MQKEEKGDPDRRGAVDATGVGCTPRGRAVQGRYDTGVPPGMPWSPTRDRCLTVG